MAKPNFALLIPLTHTHTHIQRKERELTFLFKGEVLREMPTLVVASEEEKGIRVVDLQSPQVQHTLANAKKKLITQT